eukprot:3524696-Alexandrium_andersonii.AAC.1
MASMLSGKRTSVWDHKLLLCIVMHAEVELPEVRVEVNEAICRFLGWSFEYCQQGITPVVKLHGVSDPEFDVPPGVVLAGGWRGCYSGWKGDRKERKILHRLHRHY